MRITVLLVVLASGTVALIAWARGESARTVESHGIVATYPPDWHATTQALTEVTWPPQRLVIASFPLQQDEPDDNCYPRTALEAMPDEGAFIFLFEYVRRPELVDPQSLPLFPTRPDDFELDERMHHTYECYGDSYLIRFDDKGRAFQTHVSFGEKAGAEMRSKALAVLDSLIVESAR